MRQDDFDVDNARSKDGQKTSKKAQFQTLLDEDPYQVPKELATALRFMQQAIFEAFHALEMI